MTHKTTQQQPAPDQRNQATAQTDRPQTAASPDISDGEQPPRARPLSGTGHAPCKDRKPMTHKTTQQQPAPDQRNQATARLHEVVRTPGR